ncbi:MAG: 50S ribosomal protein L11 methyltransferase [Sulfurovum sp.]|nr:MAG: 50S ribosomal protein L11 methyltransferase [Sulfurovum sp.]
MQDKYYELTITLNNELIEFVADFLANTTDEGIELGEGEIIVRSESDLTSVKDSLVSFMHTLDNSIQIEYTLQEKENKDWVKQYQDSVQPVEVGKFYIFPSWYEAKQDFINIKIDPALAFGSGHHPTTFACLEAISTYVKEQDKVIDVGCGSGILGLACKKLKAHIDLCDTDPVSIINTKENFALNHETYHALWEGSVDKTKENYDIVIANIIPDVLRFLAKALKNVTKEGGYLILSGILDKKENIVREAYANLTLEKRIQIDEWVTLIYTK